MHHHSIPTASGSWIGSCDDRMYCYCRIGCIISWGIVTCHKEAGSKATDQGIVKRKMAAVFNRACIGDSGKHDYYLFDSSAFAWRFALELYHSLDSSYDPVILEYIFGRMRHLFDVGLFTGFHQKNERIVKRI